MQHFRDERHVDTNVADADSRRRSGAHAEAPLVPHQTCSSPLSSGRTQSRSGVGLSRCLASSGSALISRTSCSSEPMCRTASRSRAYRGAPMPPPHIAAALLWMRHMPTASCVSRPSLEIRTELSRAAAAAAALVDAPSWITLVDAWIRMLSPHHDKDFRCVASLPVQVLDKVVVVVFNGINGNLTCWRMLTKSATLHSWFNLVTCAR